MIRWLLNRVRRKNPVYETMTRYPYCGFVVRVWREEPKRTDGPDREVLEILNRHFTLGSCRDAVVKIIGSLPRVAAIEILDPHGNGGLFYPDWK